MSLHPPTFHRLSLVDHLALYHAFHRNPVNRTIHVIATPVVMYTAAVLASFLRLSPDTHWLHFGTLATLVVGASLTWLDRFGGLTVMAWLLPFNGIAARIADIGWPAALGALALHGSAWFLLVVVGHLRFEDPHEWTDAPVGSSIYFHRGYNWCLKIGRPASFLDRFVQYSVGIVSPSYEIAFALGLEKALKKDVDERIAAIRSRLVLGQPPFDEASAARGAAVVPAASRWRSRHGQAAGAIS